MSDQPQAAPQARASSVEIPVGAHYLVGVGSAARGLRPRRSSMFRTESWFAHRTLAARPAVAMVDDAAHYRHTMTEILL